MKFSFVFLKLIFFASLAVSQIRVSENKHFLQTKSGEPFFWLGDTNWEMLHRLKIDEIEFLMKCRQKQGFNVLQIVALAEFRGLQQPNRYGDLPLINNDPTQLNITPGKKMSAAMEFDYWDLLDKVFEIAEAKGLYIGLLPTWGDKLAHMWGEGPIIFKEENARIYGRLLGKKYGNRKNIIWILGGDRPAVYEWENIKYDDTKIWRAMAEGIKEGETAVNADHKFMTYHPASGENRTSKYIHEEPWLDMNAFQSGHSVNQASPWHWVNEDLQKSPRKPTLDLEPCYEDHPVKPSKRKWIKSDGYFNDLDVRNRVYRTVFAGGAGVTYGHHHVWQCMDTSLNAPIYEGDTIIPWKQAINAKAATQIIHLKNLMLSRPYFSRVSDQQMLAFDQENDFRKYITATRDSEGSYAMIYFPKNVAQNYQINLQGINAKTIYLTWFNPQNGKVTKPQRLKKVNTIIVSIPKYMEDAVLIIDDPKRKYTIKF